MNVEPLVHTTREPAPAVGPHVAPGAIENVHYGSIAVVSVDGGLVQWVGDPHWSTFTRSTLKPFQALPFVRDGGPARFGWTSRQVALACASHSGEPMHVDVVRSMLAAADCDVSDLQCGCHVPGFYAALGRVPPPTAQWSPVEHNCSGKHAGFLAACRLRGEAIDGYLDPSSPLQRRIASAVADVSGVALHAMPSGTDGCSAPNYALPLSRLALAYARLAQGDGSVADGDALAALRDAMTGHPELVSGSGRSDLALMTRGDGDWVTKIGADGVQAIGIRSAGLGIAIKVADGNRDALYAVVVEVLRQLDLANFDEEDESRLEVDGWRRTKLRNSRGLPTGRIVPAFTLRAT